ncbi:MAG: gamma-glutamylcyclotransferase family protein [Thermoanaerobaculia bacterium]
MTERSIEAFFYGLFMDVDVLREKQMTPLTPRPAYVDGFALRIGERATLVPSLGARAFGMLISLTRRELSQLYSGAGLEHYRPEAVVVKTLDGESVPALCYNLPDAPLPHERNPEYAARLQALLRKLNFPPDYVASVV